MRGSILVTAVCSVLLAAPCLALDGTSGQSMLPEGARCGEPPQFGFSQLDTDVYELRVSADPPGRFRVGLAYLDGELSKEAALEPQPIRRLGVSQQLGEDHDGTLRAPSPGEAAGGAEPTTCPDAGGGLVFCVDATESGTPVALTFDRKAVLRGGGFLRLAYEEVTTTPVAGCDIRHRGSLPVKALEKHRLSFDVGPLFTFEGDGGWGDQVEAALTARSEWFTWLIGGVDIRYSAIGAVAEAPETGEENGESQNGEDRSSKELNPFEEGGGVLEANLYGVLRRPKWPWVGLSGGMGFSSVPGVEGSSLEVRERWFAALELSVQGYNAGEPATELGNASGFLRVGYSENDLWKAVEVTPAAADGSRPAEVSDESERWFLEGGIEVPRVGTTWARIFLRMFASIPRSGKGPSDIRLSALVSIDPRNWFSSLKASS